MTRIVVDPGELKRVAGFSAETAVAYAETAAALRDRPLPPMPAGLAAAIETGVAGATDRLDELSARLDAMAFLLRARAAVVDGDASAGLLLELGGDLNG